MIAPDAVRYLVAAGGGLTVLAAVRSVVGTVVVPRRVHSSLAVGVDRVVDGVFRLLSSRMGEERRHRLLAAQAPAALLVQLLAWLGWYLVGFAALTWPFVNGGIAAAFAGAGTAMCTIGALGDPGSAQHAVADLAALTTLITVALQIGYLPVLYGAFNRRETEVTLLYARAGLPAWGPELLVRTHYGFTSGVSTLATLPDFYARWERWAADVAESHVTYLPLARFRSPQPLASWVTALLAVLDSAALLLSLAPGQAPTVPARLCLRMGFTCFTEVALALGSDLPETMDAQAGISLTFEQFREAVAWLSEVGFPLERDLDQAWTDFVGWRVNYERAAYAVAAVLDAPPALWSGPRRHATAAIPPRRPRAPATRPGPARRGPERPATPA
jgi:hypothetical protein